MKYLAVIFLLSIFITGCYPEENAGTVQIAPPKMEDGAQPYLFGTKDALYMSWQQARDTINLLRYSEFRNGKWSPSKTLASGSNWFINWADFPAISVNDQGKILSHFLPKSGESTYAYDINVVLTQPDSIYKLHDDTVQAEHGFVSSIPYEENKFFLTWLDGRNTAPAVEGVHSHAGAMSLRAAVINSSGKKENDWLLDEKVCDCCQTSTARMENGVIIAYRDRSGEEYRDIAVRTYINGFWSAPITIVNDKWQINGCPVNGPKVVASGKKVVIVWFSGKDVPKVQFVYSDDNAETFSAPIIVSKNTAGRVDAVLDESGNIWISHISLEAGKPQLTASKFNREGELINQNVIGELDASRNTGFPQMEYFNKSIYFAWTNANDSTGITINRIKL